MGVLWDWDQSGTPILNIMNEDGSGVDINGDGKLGTPMQSGPFFGSSMAFAGTAIVPIPAAAWLFGCGLVGLIGTARRKAA
jgi:hypothetical protein